MNSREHPCPDCRYPRRADEEYCPTCPFLKNQNKNKPAFSFLFDWASDITHKEPEVSKEVAPPAPPVVIEPIYAAPVAPQPTINIPQPDPIVEPRPNAPLPQQPDYTIEPVRLTKNPPKGTFNPYLQREEETPKFNMTLVPRHTEATGKKEEFEGEKVTLNRNNLDRENYTISSQEHAVIERLDGKWYLNNKSSLKTTYVQVNAPTELKDGDVILLGDRMFIFRLE